MSERTGTALVVAALLVAGGAGWWLELRPPLRPAPASLDAIPQRLAGFDGVDLPVGSTVESILRADHHVQRAYRHALGDVVWLYVGYYGTARGGTPEHTPRACYTAHGWSVEREDVLRDGARSIRGRELVVEREGARRLVLYWYRSFRRTGLLGTGALRLDHVLGQLGSGRGDGALVRLSTPLVDEDPAEARARVLQLAAALEPALARHWPREHREGT